MIFSRRWPTVLLLAAWACAAQVRADKRAEARLVQGEPISASLVKIDPNWDVTFDDGQRRRVIAAADLIDWGNYRPREGKSQILLVDNSVLLADVLTMNQVGITIQSDLLGRKDLAPDQLRGLVLKPPAGLLQRDRLVRRIFSATGGEDQLLLDNGDQLSGILVSPPEQRVGPPVEGDENLHIETSSGMVTISRDKVLAMVFNPVLAGAVKMNHRHAVIGLANGSLLSVDRIVTTPTGLRLHLPSGSSLELIPSDPSSPFGDIRYFCSASSRVQYLSDIKPLDYKHVPFLELPWSYGRDENVLGGHLRFQGEVFIKGLAVHSAARLVYDLDGRYTRFEAELAIDRLAGLRGSVVYQVLLENDAGQWQPAYKSEFVRGGQPPRPLSIDVTGARRMALLVDFADRGDEWDHANWLNARLIRAAKP